jgi:hypothetical protein
MERYEYPPCLYRDAGGRIQEVPFPKGEPDRKTMSADLYCPYYNIKKGLFGPARITDIGISIFNRPAYRRDEALVQEARERLIKAILSKETPEVITESGGIEGLRGRIEADEFYL